MLMYAVAIVDIGLLVMCCWEYSIYVQMREQLMFFIITVTYICVLVHTSLVYLTASLLECCPVQVVCFQIISENNCKTCIGRRSKQLRSQIIG